MLKIQTKPKTKTITNKDKVFKGTDYESFEFSVDVKELSYDELIEIEKKEEKTGDTKEMLKEFFSKQVVSWKGFYDEDEKELPLNKKTIEQFFGYVDNINFATLLIRAVQDSFIDKKEVAVKKK